MAKQPATETPEIDEEEVREVRCSVTGTPISSIPSWYANVHVKFVSDAARNKSGLLPAPPAAPDPDELEETEESEATEISLEDVDEDLAATVVDIDFDEAEVEGDADDAPSVAETLPE
jgi:hypothetical protein